ncbi:hypothetical protein A176_006045 [Myxococcus hansupus]|uniref:Uncharacterized protein n=1 Tax=Pseudomyxococcus hansupus TaxID=1297742 RepID=A0A0H4X5I6_9BACT|nr:hypothetical protein A176_006045 [Myxococcus hansupus]
MTTSTQRGGGKKDQGSQEPARGERAGHRSFSMRVRGKCRFRRGASARKVPPWRGGR